jgi:DNA-binding MarR family transcriptional regulator
LLIISLPKCFWRSTINWQADAAQRLLEGFAGFRKFHWKHHPHSGLKPSEVWALIVIQKEINKGAPGIRISDIGHVLQVAAPTATQLINGLENAGYVIRKRDEQDRRVVHINLTPAGQREMTRAQKHLHMVFENIALYLGEEDSAKLADLLARVSDYYTSINANDS